VDAILESVRVARGAKSRPGLIVSGCLPQRFREELPKLLPEVDAFMGIDQVAQVSEIVKQAMAKRAGRIGSDPKPKVQSQKILGCRTFCGT
jgi:ribosomal protein S12 methylthiotransferase